jgi:hypothetical protein
MVPQRAATVLERISLRPPLNVEKALNARRQDQSYVDSGSWMTTAHATTGNL